MMLGKFSNVINNKLIFNNSWLKIDDMYYKLTEEVIPQKLHYLHKQLLNHPAIN